MGLLESAAAALAGRAWLWTKETQLQLSLTVTLAPWLVVVPQVLPLRFRCNQEPKGGCSGPGLVLVLCALASTVQSSPVLSSRASLVERPKFEHKSEGGTWP